MKFDHAICNKAKAGHIWRDTATGEKLYIEGYGFELLQYASEQGWELVAVSGELADTLFFKRCIT